jgi:hypothetical protein
MFETAVKLEVLSMKEPAFSEVDVNGTHLTVECRPDDVRFRLEARDGRESLFYASEAQAIMLANSLVPCSSWWNTAAIQLMFSQILDEILKARPPGYTDKEDAIDEGLEIAEGAIRRVCRAHGVQLPDQRQ